MCCHESASLSKTFGARIFIGWLCSSLNKQDETCRHDKKGRCHYLYTSSDFDPEGFQSSLEAWVKKYGPPDTVEFRPAEGGGTIVSINKCAPSVRKSIIDSSNQTERPILIMHVSDAIAG